MSNDKIRAKRLAKLASNSRSRSPSTPAAVSAKVDKKSDSNSLESKPLDSKRSEIKPSEPKPQEKPEAPSCEDLTAWSNHQLEQILQVTLNMECTGGQHFINSTFEECVEANVDPLLSKDLIDRALLEILTEAGLSNTLPIKYLHNCWIKGIRAKRMVKPMDANREFKFDLINEVIRLTSSFALLCLQVPDMFVNNVSVDRTLEFVVSEVNEVGDFVLEILLRAKENDSVVEFLDIVVPYLSDVLKKMDLSHTSDFAKILSLFQLLVSDKDVAAAFPQIEGFHPSNLKANQFETNTILGPLFRVSPLLPQLTKSNYSGEKSKAQVSAIHESLQAELKMHLDKLFYIADRIVRGSAESRSAILCLFADMVNKNHLRAGEHANIKDVASHGLMFNVTMVLVKLCQPFLADFPQYSKLDKVDIHYLSKNKILDFSEETRLNASIQQTNEFYSKPENKSDSDPNFISDIFFLTVCYLQYGLGGIYPYFKRLKRYIKQITQQVEKLESSSSDGSPFMQRFLHLQLPKLKAQLDGYQCEKHSIEMVFSFKDLQMEIFDFVVGTATFVMRLIDPQHKFPGQAIKVPILDVEIDDLDDQEYLRDHSPIPFRYFPEFLVQGCIDYAHFISNFLRNPLMGNPKLERFIEFSIVLLRCSELIFNPHLKARLVEVLFFGSLPLTDGSAGFMIDIFNNNTLINQNILFSLLDFYVMVEKTGASSQFYDKFNTRYHISVILEKLWDNPIYRNQLHQQEITNVKFFVRFVARMLNDTTFLLDEALSKLTEVHDLQVETDVRSRGGAASREEDDNQLAESLSKAEDQAKSYMGLSNKTIELFKLFTKESPKSFTIVEVVERLASMLDFNLAQLTCSKCRNLKVVDPEKYDFKPRELLLSIATVYVNLSQEPDFIAAVSKDDRSFSKHYFDKATGILTKFGLASGEFLAQFQKVATDAQAQREQEAIEESELGEIPDEYLDPLMYTLMENPVILPSSRISIDRSTIKAHLLSDPTDPFNRMPLKLEDVVDNVDLKREIQEFKQRRKGGDIEMSE